MNNKWKKILVILFFFYVLVVWGLVYFSILILLLGVAAFYFFKRGRWPWTSLTLTIKEKNARGPIILETKPKITFADVAGIDEAKEELMEIVNFLKNKEPYLNAGARLPRGALMIGPPGVGKTLSAKAIAGEAGVSFIEMSGSSFVNKYVGVGADNIRHLFSQAKTKAPCIIFVDEFDGLGHRMEESSGGDREYNQTINEMLVQMDGFSSSGYVIVLAATNRPDKIDEAFLRPGRFDRQIYFDLPDINGREEILKVHARNKFLANDISLRDIAKLTSGFSGADLENLLNEAAIIAGKAGRKEINYKDITNSKDSVMMGRERKSLIIDQEEKELTAYHEAGHAILAAILEHCDRPEKVTIIPRSLALGATSLSREKDRHNLSKPFLLDQLTMLLGGRAAEKAICNRETSGAKNDIAKATEIGTAMVCEYGMSDCLGPAIIPKNSDEARTEIRKLLKASEKRAIDIIKENVESVQAMAKLLLQKETISGEEIADLLKNKSP